MEKQCSAVGQGLMKVFFGVCLLAAHVLLNTTGLFLGLMPLRVLSAVVCLAGFFLVFVGLTAAAVVERAYRRAIWCARLSTIAGLMAALIAGQPIMMFLLVLFRQCLELGEIGIVCRATDRLTAEKREKMGTSGGSLTWVLCLLCAVGSGLCGGISWFFLHERGLMALVTTYLVLQLVERMIYMAFLYRSSRMLGRE